MVKLASVRNRGAEQHLNWSLCWACDQYLSAAYPKIAATFFYFTVLLLKMLYRPVVQAMVNKQKP